MRFIRPLILILGFVIVAAPIFVGVGIIFPRSADFQAAGWVIYSVGAALILLAYFRRQRREKGRNHPTGKAQNSVTDPETSGKDPGRHMEQVRERIRLKKARGHHADH